MYYKGNFVISRLQTFFLNFTFLRIKLFILDFSEL